MLVTGAATATVGEFIVYCCYCLIIVILAVVVTEIINSAKTWTRISRLKEIIGGVGIRLKRYSLVH